MRNKRRCSSTALCTLFCALFVCAVKPKRHRSVVSSSTQPAKVSCSIFDASSTACANILATVTGGWALEKYSDHAHFLYIDIILAAYAEMCESGYNVTVFLISYDFGEQEWQRYVTSSKRRCHRSMFDFTVEMETFPLRQLPPGAYGTKGDLAIRHREIFLRYRKDFSLFISQEDDVRVRVGNVNYFIDAYNTFHATQFYPTFIFSEFSNGTWFSDFRLKYGTVVKHRGVTVYTSQRTVPCMYMLTQKELNELAKNKTGWIDPNRIQGEFNVEVATSTPLLSYKKMAIPIERWRDAVFHHLSNRYVNLVRNMKYELRQSRGALTFAEQQNVFCSCFAKLPNEYICTNDECFQCSKRHQKVDFNVTSFVRAHGTNYTPVGVTYTCRSS